MQHSERSRGDISYHSLSVCFPSDIDLVLRFCFFPLLTESLASVPEESIICSPSDSPYTSFNNGFTLSLKASGLPHYLSVTTVISLYFITFIALHIVFRVFLSIKQREPFSLVYVYSVLVSTKWILSRGSGHLQSVSADHKIS